MKFLFVIQGEGRGHMTQAIALSSLLRRQGHELASVVVGKSPRRKIPEFFRREINASIHEVESPNFECDGANKKILIGKTLRKNSGKLGTFWKSLRQIDRIVCDAKPDVILNFYDLLGGLYNFLFRPKAEFWVIGHQYLITHPDFHFAPGRPVDKALFQLNTFFTGLGAKERLALSFLPKKNSPAEIRVVPPLLRKEVHALTPSEGDFYLAYMVNAGYAAEAMHFAQQNPELKIKAYWDKKDAAESEYPLPNLSFHQVNDRTFLQDMAACKGLACTAGFESVCEAMYLGKPVLMIPVAGQYEQACNALDGQASGAGIASERFDFAKLAGAQKKDAEASLVYRDWVASWRELLRDLVWESERRNSKISKPLSDEPVPALG
ncbi:glycosyltransferase [Algoriphagus sp. H41]|uniref:Glycosyltransferase n=1 Tax=Algoriphagus oliviformis TaxID=2811231 RepID=A0ABS3C668_9BACT|nr:glycosyltransferase family protein [Algoriphagus oliviformis]MBN7811089.1 glycosyltransferase [Algoriphagus oliviformis]